MAASRRKKPFFPFGPFPKEITHESRISRLRWECTMRSSNGPKARASQVFGRAKDEILFTSHWFLTGAM